MAPPRGSGCVRQIVEKEPHPIIVVVSAFQGVTDKLTEIFDLAVKGDKEYKQQCEALTRTHKQVIDSLFADKEIKVDLENGVDTIFSEVEGKAEKLAKGKSKSILTEKEGILAAGELASSLIISKFIPDMTLVDPRNLIKAEPGVYFPNVDFAGNK